MSVRLMIADGHAAVRAGVMGLIHGTEIEMICQAETYEQTVKLALASQPDVLLLDVRLAGCDGLSAWEQIRRQNPRIAVLFFSADEDFKAMVHAHDLGALGFVLKGVRRDDLLQSIRCVARGESAWTARQMRQIVSRSAAAVLAAHDRNPLSPRELEVLGKIVNGLSNEGISRELEVNIETVKQHVKHILNKLHLENRTQAALFLLWSELSDDAPVSKANKHGT